MRVTIEEVLSFKPVCLVTPQRLIQPKHILFCLQGCAACLQTSSCHRSPTMPSACDMPLSTAVGWSCGGLVCLMPSPALTHSGIIYPCRCLTRSLPMLCNVIILATLYYEIL